jgi:adenylate cyclase
MAKRLHRLRICRVYRNRAAFHYKDREADARTVGRELGVRAVFKGRVSHFNDTLAISAELIDVRDNSQIWGQEYSRTPSDVFALPGEVAMSGALRKATPRIPRPIKTI